jgi:hypothetical protein
MTGKFDHYLTYITRDFQEEKSLEQPGKVKTKIGCKSLPGSKLAFFSSSHQVCW